MSWRNYHGHCHYCDGKGTPEEYIEKAIENCMSVLGISCHAPVPFETSWTMPSNKLPHYLDTLKELKHRYQGVIQLLSSLEVDYIPGIAGPMHPQVIAADLDYVIGSVHFVDTFTNGEHWSIDNNNIEFEKGVKEIFNNDIRKAVTRYFFLQQELCATQTPNILGHMDKIKMHNSLKMHFDEQSRWYQNLVFDTLKLAVEKEVIVEINTKYFERTGVLFPGPEHFKWMRKNGVRVTINSDAHNPNALITGFGEVAQLLIQAGYFELWQWDGKTFVPHGFSRQGVEGLAKKGERF